MTTTTTLPSAPPLACASSVVADPRLDAIRSKVERGERLTLDDGEALYATPDIWSVIEMADSIRRKLHGKTAYYNINRHLNYSNVCALSCTFCEFARKKDEPGAYTHDMDQVREVVRQAVESGATEMHSVGGLHPYLPWDYYPELVRTIRDTARAMGSDLHVKAFTAVEVVHLAKIAKKYKQSDRQAGIRWVLEQLKEAGLGSLPGGGAEVFDDRVHDEAFKGKIRSDVWLDVHRVAHELGLNTNATILYGHIEEKRERLVHMDMLRTAQDEALVRLGYMPDTHGAVTLMRDDVSQPTPALNAKGGYFQTIIPLPFFPDGSKLEHLPGPTGLENLRTLAIARLMLDNFPHVKSFWIMQTLPMSQLMLQAGADDIDGTVVWYDITKVGASTTHQETTVWDLEKAIREAGFEPVERDTLYRRVIRDGKKWHTGTKS
ncbi:MAG: CofH family radical SAM protein [Phycisphaeraceae bacterium]|nr:CofH family radical SAM protein [Phycisphaerales bacterium]MCB9861021.1 CofH family radical SAM protein [Phycisphaeraceae bacterium]